MPGRDMADLMPDHPGQLRFVCRHGDQRGGYEYLPRRKGEGIDIFCVDHREIIVVGVAFQVVCPDDFHPELGNILLEFRVVCRWIILQHLRQGFLREALFIRYSDIDFLPPVVSLPVPRTGRSGAGSKNPHKDEKKHSCFFHGWTLLSLECLKRKG